MNWQKLYPLLFASLLLVLVLVLPTPRPKNQAAKIIISMTNWGFNPQNLTIDQGQTVEFKNIGQENHWPASNIHPTHDIYPEFDPQKGIKPGESWQFTFKKAGSWRFHDHLAPLFTGNIEVKGDPNNPLKESLPEKMKRFKNQAKNSAENFKTDLLLAYFRIFPDDLEKHFLPNKSLARIAGQQNDRLLSFIVQKIGPEKAMQKLFDESDQGKRFNCHTSAHSIGRVSYEIFGSEALEKNITICHSGYLHGVTAAFVKKKGPENLTANLTALCEKAKTQFGKLTCYHGSGHGLMGYFDNDLPKAINTCREYDSKFKQDNCLVGVFMENIGSRLGDSLSMHPTIWLSDKDPQFPCNRIDQTAQVQYTCYAIQTEWMEYVEKGDLDKVVNDCLFAHQDSIPSCFFGYGQDAAAQSPKDQPGQILSLCEKVPKSKDYFEKCLAGAQAVIMDFWGPNMTTQGGDFCNVLPEANKKHCFQRLEEREKDISKTSQAIITIPVTLTSAYQHSTTHLSASISSSLAKQKGKKSFINKISHFKRGVFNKLTSFYLHFFPQDKDRYLSHINIKRIVDQSDDMELDWAIQTFGPQKLIAALLAESDNGSRFSCHTPAHEIGRRSYKVLGSEALQKDITLCHSGYRHGVTAAFAEDVGSLNVIEKINALCRITKTDFERGMCYHSAGHGVMASLDNNLPKAIDLCETLSSNADREECLSGTFMENVQIGWGDATNPAKTQWTVKETDPLFPCFAVSSIERIKQNCIAIQADWLNYLYKSNMNEISKICLGLEDNLRSGCFFGYGKVAVLSSHYDPLQSAKLCDALPQMGDYRSQCVAGAQLIIMNFWGPNMTTQGSDFCHVTPIDTRDGCLQRLNKRLQDLGQVQS